MNRDQVIGTVVIALIVFGFILGVAGLAIMDGWNFREQCVAAGGYVVQQGSSQPVCVR
jgi:hypothetical protein